MKNELQPVPKDTNAFFGLRRSGNHAVMDWIFGHASCWVHYNNCYMHNGQAETTHVERAGYGERPFTLASFEDYELCFLREHLSDSPRQVLLLRDPFNLFASRLKMVRNFNANKSSGFSCLDALSGRAIDLWKQYATAFLDGYLCTNISFNEWYKNPEYRQDTSERLGFAFTDKKFGSQDGWKHSGGSSFGKVDPLNSYKHMQDDPEYLSYFDEETIELARRIFNWVPDLNFQPVNHAETDELLRSVQNLHQAGRTDVALFCLEQSPQNSRTIQMREFLIRGLIPNQTDDQCSQTDL